MGVKFIQVGVGGFGGGWLRRLLGTRGVDVVGAVDVNEAGLRHAVDAYGLDAERCHGSLTEALEATNADAVLCVTPPAVHRRVAVEAMRAGLHVLTEKPLAETRADCRAMAKVARETGRICAVSQQYRYRSDMLAMTRAIQRGRIGEVGQVTIEFAKGVHFGGFRQKMAYPVLQDMAIHHVDLIRAVTGLDAVRARGEAWNPPWSHYDGDCSSSVVFEMNNGARVMYNTCWCSQGSFSDWNGNWRIEGTRGTVVYQDGKVAGMTVGGEYQVKRNWALKPRATKRAEQDYVLAGFLRAVRGGASPDTTVEDNLKSMGMVFAALEAVKTGRRVKVPEL